MALSDSDVQKQINQMIAFIEQEANEKAEEIDTKAEEEFNIEKSRLFQEQKIKIMDFFEKREKQVELQRRIQNSHIQNDARLKVLQAREKHIRNVLEEAQQKLVELTKDKTMYQKVLQKLLEQGLFQLIEKDVVVRCRKEDVQMLQTVLPIACEEYANATKRKCNVTLDQENFLSPECSGGVELYSMRGKIKSVNTLENRLDLISQQIMPDIRTALFGRNANRKFDD